MIRQADKQDIPRIAEIIVFGKRVAYRPIFEDDHGLFNKLQVALVTRPIKQHQQGIFQCLLHCTAVILYIPLSLEK